MPPRPTEGRRSGFASITKRADRRHQHRREEGPRRGRPMAITEHKEAARVREKHLRATADQRLGLSRLASRTAQSESAYRSPGRGVRRRRAARYDDQPHIPRAHRAGGLLCVDVICAHASQYGFVGCRQSAFASIAAIASTVPPRLHSRHACPAMQLLATAEPPNGAPRRADHPPPHHASASAAQERRTSSTAARACLHHGTLTVATRSTYCHGPEQGGWPASRIGPAI